MSTAVPAHPTSIEVAEPLPPEFPVGGEITVKIKVSCPAGCDLRNVPLKVATADGATIVSDFGPIDFRSSDLMAGDGEDIGVGEATGYVQFKAPPRAGDQVWNLVLPAQQGGGVAHAQCAIPIVFRTTALDSSLAAWDIPAAVVTGERFAIKVGAKSSADWVLRGRGIEVCDQEGAVAARGVLGAEPFPGTAALYWDSVELCAPTRDGICSWSVRFEARELELDHNSSSTRFSFVVVPPPAHELTIRVVEQDKGTPISDVQIRLGAYRGETGARGEARIKTAKGTFELNIWKVGYDAPPRMVEVDADATIEVEAIVVPEYDPDAGWG
jgi:hypothetical protein